MWNELPPRGASRTIFQARKNTISGILASIVIITKPIFPQMVEFDVCIVRCFEFSLHFTNVFIIAIQIPVFR